MRQRIEVALLPGAKIEFLESIKKIVRFTHKIERAEYTRLSREKRQLLDAYCGIVGSGCSCDDDANLARSARSARKSIRILSPTSSARPMVGDFSTIIKKPPSRMVRCKTTIRP